MQGPRPGANRPRHMSRSSTASAVASTSAAPNQEQMSGEQRRRFTIPPRSTGRTHTPSLIGSESLAADDGAHRGEPVRLALDPAKEWRPASPERKRPEAHERERPPAAQSVVGSVRTMSIPMQAWEQGWSAQMRPMKAATCPPWRRARPVTSLRARPRPGVRRILVHIGRRLA